MTVVGNVWDEILEEEYGKEYFTRLMKEVDEEYAKGVVYPPRPLVYSAMARVPYDKVRVVILGQDPYHGEGQANGMAFAVGKGVPLPPSLVNIFKEIEAETGVEPNGSTQYRAHRARTLAAVARGARLANVHRRGNRFARPPRRTHGVYALGSERASQKIAYSVAPPRARKRSPEPAFGVSRFFRMRAFRKSERISRFARAPADRLGVCGRRRQSRILQAVRRQNRTDLRSLPLWAGSPCRQVGDACIYFGRTW